MKKCLLMLAIILCMGLNACGSSVFDTESVDAVLATGGTSGTYFAVGSAMATVLNPILDRSELSVLASGGSKANIGMLEDKTATLAIVQNDIMYYAYNGTDLFAEEGKHDKFGALAALYDETVQIVTCDESLKSVADLKGKTVCVGDAGSGGEYNARQILEAYDITFDDITVVNASFAESAESLKSGQIDAAFIVAGAPTKAVVELAEDQPIHLIGLDDDHIRALQEKYRFYSKTVLAKDTYTGPEEDALTVSVRATLVASDKLPDEQVNELMEALFANAGKLSSAHAALKDLTPESALEGISIPLHDGAKAYYRAQGLDAE